MSRLMKAKGGSTRNEVVREMIEAFRTMFGLPPQAHGQRQPGARSATVLLIRLTA